MQIKYMIGPGGAKIQEIQRKSKARVQVQKVGDAPASLMLTFAECLLKLPGTCHQGVDGDLSA
jgi:hypothetical protein